MQVVIGTMVCTHASLSQRTDSRISIDALDLYKCIQAYGAGLFYPTRVPVPRS
jgi:hypothetical protein